MVVAHTTLPDLSTLDAESLKALILSQHEQLLSRDHEIEHLTLLIAKLRRMQFGRKSEKIERQLEQLDAPLEKCGPPAAPQVVRLRSQNPSITCASTPLPIQRVACVPTLAGADERSLFN